MHKSVEYLRLAVLALLLVTVAAIPKPDEDQPAIPHNPLEHASNNAKHYEGEQHNTQFDHEAFLGQDEAETFKQLTPEESKRRLGLIVDRIDQDKDGFVTLSELKRWIQFTQRRFVDEDTNRLWTQQNPDNLTSLSWDDYRRKIYGFLETLSEDELDYVQNGVSYKTLVVRDERRWEAADADKDGSLTREEFAVFLHPEEYESMREIILSETIEDIDKDKDGRISAEEYIGDMYRGGEPDEEEPEWVVSERDTFVQFRDTDGDGFLDREEVRAWVVPQDFDNSEAEAKHLMFEADADNDKQLTKEEILAKYDVFVGSQATNFGEELARHDEF